MTESDLASTQPSRGRRMLAAALCMLLTYVLALNLLWEMWSETGTFGVAMDLSMRLFGVPGRRGVYMLLPWVHVAVTILLCTRLYRAVVQGGSRSSPDTPPAADSKPRASSGGPGFFTMWGLLTIAVTSSFAGLKYLGEHGIEVASVGRPVQELTLGAFSDTRVLDAPTRLLAEPLEREIVEGLPLHRKTSAKRTLYVPLVPAQSEGAELRAVLQVVIPLQQDVRREDWAPPYEVRRIFAPIPTWVRGELGRRGQRVASDAVLVERVWLDADGRALTNGVSARQDAIIISAIGAFCGLLLIGLEWLMRRRG